MDKAKIKAICDPTRLRILDLLCSGELTNIELHKKLENDGIHYRETIFKGLKKLLAADLVKREFKEKTGYKYSLNFKELKVGNKLKLKTQ